MTITRRSFIKKSAAAAGALAIPGRVASEILSPAPVLTPGPGNKWPGRVAINFNKGAVTGTSTPVIPTIQTMVNECIMRLTDQTTVGAAWKAVFPDSLSLTSKIAIKVNTANSGLPAPHWSSVKAVTDGLRLMELSGVKFPIGNITVYDMSFLDGMSKAGYTSDNLPGIAIAFTSPVDGGDGAMNNKKYASVLKEADFLINVFSPRGHTYPPEGSQFTLNFKSHVGTYASDYKEEAPALFHPSGVPPTFLLEKIRDINCTGPVFKKNVLSVCSGIFAMNEGFGPAGAAASYLNYAKTMDPAITSKSASSTTIIMSTDPISVEMQSIKMMRLNKNPAGGYGVSDMPPYLQASAGISGALSGTTYNIGIIDEKQMDVRRVINGVTSIGANQHSAKSDKSRIISASPMTGMRSTFIEFALPSESRGGEATIEVFALNGSLLSRRKQPVLGVRNHYSWNNRNTAGAFVEGPCIVRVTCGKTRLSARFAAIE